MVVVIDSWAIYNTAPLRTETRALVSHAELFR